MVAVSQACTGRVASVHWPCRMRAPTVSLAISQAVSPVVSCPLSSPSVTIQKWYHDPSLCRAPCRAPTTLYHSARSAISQRCCALCRSLSSNTPSSQAAHLSRYAHLYRDTISNGQAMRARAARLARRPAVSWHMVGRVVAESWPYRGPLATPRQASSALCHDTIPCIMTLHRQMGRSPFSLLFFFFFFHSFFFHFCPTY